MSDQKELFQAQTTWFHVFKSMIDCGDMAKLSGSSIKVYMVIKSHTNFSTGRAFPAIETIAKHSGISHSQVIRCIKELVDSGYLSKEKKGRSNHYTLREKVECLDEQGRPSVVATWDYLPSTVRDAQAELKNFIMTGKSLEGGIIHIERLTLNVFQDDAQQNNFNMDTLPPDLKKQMEKLLVSANKKK